MRGSSAEKKLALNAVVIAAGAFFAKVIGAFYRIPLTNLLGGAGLGLYQMVFPVYCILLDFAGAGLPCGLSKLVSENAAEQNHAANASLLKTALLLMAAAGVAAFLIMFVFARPIAALQGNVAAFKAYKALAPAVLFVALLSCYRGYFQGYQKMLPTALSQLAEQLVKLGAGLCFVTLLMPSVEDAAAGAAAAVTLSEAVALLGLFITWRVHKKRGTFAPFLHNGKQNTADSKAVLCEIAPKKKARFRGDAAAILKICLPVTLVGIALPVSQMIDSFLIVNLLKKHTENATALFGLFTGGVQSVISLPVAICYGVAVAVVPFLSGVSKKQAKGGGKYALYALGGTLILSALMAAACAIFAPLGVKILFFSLSAEEKLLIIRLLRFTAPCIVTMSVLQTANSVLIGKSRPYAPLVGLGAGVAVKTVLEIFLLPVQNIGIFAAAISLNACYFVAVFVNLLYIIRVFKRQNARNEEKCDGSERKFTRKYKADCS